MGEETPGLLVVISGPSGAGKGSVRRALSELRPGLVYAVSCTTRPPRPGECDGEHYFFVSEQEFQRKLAAGELVEWARVYGNYYGTPRQPMESLLEQGTDVIVEKDPQGAMTLKEVYPRAVYVFIMPPSISELRKRIVERGTESAQAIRQRLSSADGELNYVRRYDYIVMNEDVQLAAERLVAIMTAEKCRIERSGQLLSQVLNDGKGSENV